MRRADGTKIYILDTRNGRDGTIEHLVEDAASVPEVGEKVCVELDWERRYRHMRMHTCLHLLGAVLKFGVTGGSIGADRSRLDFDMQDTVDKPAVTEALNRLIAEDHEVRTIWIADDELDARPELIRTMSVKPPRGAGRVRLLEIPGVDLQPCGGTHVARTGEIGRMELGKVEKKGKRNRRVNIVFGS
jgi:misacylated tRNA(Ala) deacylase